MKKAYRILALVLMLLMLTGCTGGNGGQIIGGNNSPTEEPESTAKVQYIPKRVKGSKKLPVLKLVCVLDSRSILGKNPRKTCQENAVKAVNQYLKEIDAGFQIQMVMITGMEMNYGMGQDCFEDSRVREEAADADLLYADFFPERMVEYLEPITDYIADSGAPLCNAVPHENLWFQTTLEGEIYALPYRWVSPDGPGWIVESEVLERCGLTPEDFQREYWEMDEIFAQIYEEYGTSFMMVMEDNPFLGLADGRICSIPDNIWSEHSKYYTFVAACYGTNSDDGHPRILNILDTDYIKQIQQAMPQYTAAGYTFSDQMVFHKTQLVTYSTIYTDTPMLRDGKWYIPVGQQRNRYQLYGFMTGI